jgi:formylglycine-generating enzyme required for sulfatase activity
MFCEAVTAAAPTVYDCEGYRLPTDAEWEYAARAGTRTAFYAGPITCYSESVLACNPDAALEKAAWYCYNANGTTHGVAQLLPNGWGLFDMLGNVFEWTNDRSDGLGAQRSTDPDGVVPPAGVNRNIRGGDIFVPAVGCRAATQLESGWTFRSPGQGFRLVRTLD